jgi:hypothetical protein
VSDPSRRALLVAFGLVLALASLVRVWNLDWSLPSLTEEALPVHVAIGMWGFEDGQPDLDPDTVGWPALSFYVQHALQKVHSLVGDFDDPLDYYVAWRLDPTGPVLLGRATSLLCMLGVVLVALLVGRRLAGASGALVAGLLCALSPMLVRHAQLVEPDALVTVFSALALVWLLRLAQRGAWLDYLWCGLWIGLGTASKYTPALLALSLLAVHLDAARSARGKISRPAFTDRRLWLAAAAALGVFLATNPYFLGDLAVLRRDLGYQATHMSAGHFGHAGLGYVRYFVHVLPGALGLAGFLAGLAGMGLGFRDRRVRVLVWFTLPWILVLGAFSTSFDRYMLPVVLPLALGAGLLVSRIRRPALAVAAGAILLVQPAMATFEYQRLQSADDTRDLAREWVLEHVDRDQETLALEYHGPDLEFGDPASVAAEPVFARLDPDQQERLLAGPRFRALRIPMYSVRSDLTGFYYDPRHYLAFDWLMVSGGVARRYREDPGRFGSQVAFYDLLEEIAAPAWSVVPEGTTRGPRIDVYRIDEDFRAVVRERFREATPAEMATWRSRVHPAHFVDFLLTVAEYAEFAEAWHQAALYYATVAEVAVRPEIHALAVEKCAAMLFSDGDLEGAAAWYGRLEKIPSHRAVALGNLGLIAERRGDHESARRRYEEVLELDEAGEYGQWARQRLDALPR